MEVEGKPRARVEDLWLLERQLEREWWWLHWALNAVAELQAGGPSANPAMFRRLPARAREIDRRRTELSVQIAQRTGAAARA